MSMRVKLDRTMCDGFGACAARAPEHFSLDEWGYVNLVGDGAISDADEDAVRRAMLDCPVNAIIELSSDGRPLAVNSRVLKTDILGDGTERKTTFRRHFV